MSDKATARIGWIDEFKGFVLLLVCLYHVEQSFPQAQMGMLHLSALRMSAFFFISGMLFSTRRFGNFKAYFIHKTHVLLVPYILLSLLFPGDIIFAGSRGRSDLFGGDDDALVSGIKNKLLSLPKETVVFPGHGPMTTIGDERRWY